MRYIDADKLITEIDRLLKVSESHRGEAVVDGSRQTLYWIKDFITSLQQEQPEMDFQFFAKEMDSIFALPKDMTENTEENPLNWEYAIARHFYELGLNAETDEPKIKGWVARDEINSIYLHWEKPHKIYSCGLPVAWRSPDIMQPIKRLSNALFPDLKFTDGPIEVELTIHKV